MACHIRLAIALLNPLKPYYLMQSTKTLVMQLMYFNNLLLVFLDNSQDNCIGSINKNALKQNWTEYGNIIDSYACLKICMQKHERYSWF